MGNLVWFREKVFGSFENVNVLKSKRGAGKTGNARNMDRPFCSVLALSRSSFLKKLHVLLNYLPPVSPHPCCLFLLSLGIRRPATSGNAL